MKRPSVSRILVLLLGVGVLVVTACNGGAPSRDASQEKAAPARPVSELHKAAAPAALRWESAPAAQARNAAVDAESVPASGGSAMPPGFVPQPFDRARGGRKVVRNAELVLAAKDTGAAVRRLSRISSEHRGYLASVSSSKDGDLMSYVLSLKVPSDAFESALEEAKAAALRIESESVSTQDVTDQYVDLDARSRALHGTEKELLALLSESRSRGSKVSDIMEVFGELTSIRTQIEQIQGQLRQMEQSTAFSTLTITVRPDALSRPVVTASWRPSETLHADLAALAGIGRGLVDLGIGVLVLGVPAALALLVAAWTLVRMSRMAKRLTGRSLGAAPPLGG